MQWVWGGLNLNVRLIQREELTVSDSHRGGHRAEAASLFERHLQVRLLVVISFGTDLARRVGKWRRREGGQQPFPKLLRVSRCLADKLGRLRVVRSSWIWLSGWLDG